MPTHVAQRRDFHEMEVRRQLAARLFATGKDTQGAIARRLGVSRQSVLRWFRAWRQGGRGALRGAGRAGRKPKLEPRVLPQIDAALRQGPRAFGFATNLWTLARVAVIIKRLTGVQYRLASVWRLLQKWGWPLQRPAKRARERDEAAIREWVSTRWPQVKKTGAGAARGSSSKTRAGSRSDRRSAAPGPRGARLRS